MAPVSEKPVMCSYVKEHRIMCFISIIIFFLFFQKKGAGGWFCELPFVVSKTEIPFGGYLAFYQSIKQFNPMNHVLPSDQANFQERVYFDSSLTCKSKYHATRVLW